MGFLDLTGMKFGKLTVIQRAENQGKRARWECKCECGNTVYVRTDSLKSGNTKSCGCYKKELARENLKKNGKNKITVDLINQKFGKLTVISLEKDENNHSYWNCLCECGNYYKAKTNELTSGKRVSCGCGAYVNMLNQKFGKLTVIEKSDKKGADRSLIWKCQCECGNIIEVNGSNLRSGHTTSCGCINSKGEQKINRLLKENNIPFETQKTFENCYFSNTGYKAKFDFYIDNKYLIEYDGIQHFSQVNNIWDNTEKIKLRDKYKESWCKKNGIPLIRIPYTHYDNLCIKDLLLETSQFIV